MRYKINSSINSTKCSLESQTTKTCLSKVFRPKHKYHNNVYRGSQSLILESTETIVYSPCGGQLGDCWLFASYVLLNKIKFVSYGENQEKKLSQIFPLMDSEFVPIRVSSGIGKIRRVGGRFSRSHKYIKTKKKWTNTNSGIVCYQFDGKTGRGRKNLRQGEHDFIIDAIEKSGKTAVRLGSHISLEECVNIIAGSDMFIGVDSGMSHICHSVGIPTYILKNRLSSKFVRRWHDPNEYTLCGNVYDAAEKMGLICPKSTKKIGRCYETKINYIYRNYK